MASLTWLGHGSLRLDTADGTRVYIDPWLSAPTTPASEKDPERADLIAVTHGHGDHVADVASVQQKTGATVVAINELAAWFTRNGIPEDKMIGFNKGGTIEAAGLRFAMTNAFHSGSTPDGSYGGEPAGFVIEADDQRIYVAGDTSVFGDMALIARIYEPTVAVLPIGDWYTMGPKEAAVALELLGNVRCLPYHWGTFPIFTGTPQALAALTSAQVEQWQPGDTVTL